MNEAYKREQLHITLSPTHKKKLIELKEKLGFSSISRAVEHLIMEKSIASRIDTLIKTLEAKHIQERSVADTKILNDWEV